MTYLEAAHLILAEAGTALSEEEMVSRAIAKGLIKPTGKSPVKSIGVVLRRASQNPASAFENAGPRLWQLKPSADDEPSVSMREAAHQILKKAGRPLHYREITRRAIRLGMIRPEGRTPALTLRARMGDDMNRNPATPFVRVGDGTYALKEWPQQPKAPAAKKPARKRQDCACCGFNPAKTYGDIGEDALLKHKEDGGVKSGAGGSKVGAGGSKVGASGSKIKETVLVCGNCQLMLKRTTLIDLKARLAESKQPVAAGRKVRSGKVASTKRAKGQEG
jgi:hypothetical protein